MKKVVILHAQLNRVMHKVRTTWPLFVSAILLFLGIGCQNKREPDVNLMKMPACTLGGFDLYEHLYALKVAEARVTYHECLATAVAEL